LGDDDGERLRHPRRVPYPGLYRDMLVLSLIGLITSGIAFVFVR